MKIIVSAHELMDKSLWSEFCSMTGMNVYAVYEGLLDINAELELTLKQAKELGLIRDCDLV